MSECYLAKQNLAKSFFERYNSWIIVERLGGHRNLQKVAVNDGKAQGFSLLWVELSHILRLSRENINIVQIEKQSPKKLLTE